MCTDGAAHSRVPAGVGDLPRRRGGAARVPSLRRLQAQAAQPHEVHDQDARLDAVAGGVRPRAGRHTGCAARCRRSRSIRPPTEAMPDVAARPRRRRTGRDRRARARRAGQGPGHHAGGRAGAEQPATRTTRAGARRTCGRRSSSASRSAIATVPLGDLTSAQMRVIGRLSRAYGDGTVRVTMDQDLVFRWVKPATFVPLYRRLAAPASGSRRRGDDRRRRQLPGRRIVPARGHAVARARPPARRSSARAPRSHRGGRRRAASRSAAARTAAASITSRRSDSRAASAASAARAVPQYFVMVGGGAEHGGASFGRLAAKIPARPDSRRGRSPDRAVCHESERPASRRLDFFGRVNVERVRLTLADLERLTSRDAVPTDFVDLAESAELHRRSWTASVPRRADVASSR